MRSSTSGHYVSQATACPCFCPWERCYTSDNRKKKKQNREEKEIESDDKLYSEISADLRNVDEKIPKLSYIATATDNINAELEKLSIHHKKQKIVFDASSSNVDNFINNPKQITVVEEKLIHYFQQNGGSTQKIINQIF